MLIIKRKVSKKGNSLMVTIPKKELNGEEVIIFDKEAYNELILKKND